MSDQKLVAGASSHTVAGANVQAGFVTSMAPSLPAVPSVVNSPPKPSSPPTCTARITTQVRMPSTMTAICLTSVQTTPPVPPTTV